MNIGGKEGGRQARLSVARGILRRPCRSLGWRL